MDHQLYKRLRKENFFQWKAMEKRNKLTNFVKIMPDTFEGGTVSK